MSCRTRSWAAALSAAAILAATAAGRTADDPKSASEETTKDEITTVTEKAADKPASDEAILSALRKKVDAHLIQFPLEQFTDWVEQQGQIQVEIDNRCLNEGGLDPEAILIDLDLHQVCLASVLYHALRGYDLTYVISNGALLITTTDRAASVLDVEIYPAADLVTFRSPDGKVREDYDPLIELIATTCATTTWESVGGAGTISGYGGMLVVSQTRDVQLRIAALLATLRSTIAAQAKGDVAPRPILDPISNDSAALAALETASKYDLVQTPVRQFAESIAQEKGVNVLIDIRAFLEAGIDPESVELTGEYKSAPLRSILNRLLHQHDLAYIVDHEAIVITTADRASTVLETQVFPVADQLAGEVDSDESRMRRADKLKEALTMSVDASSWDHNGGGNQITFAAPWNLMVVSATAPTQRKLSATLDQLRDARRRQAAMKLAPTDALADADPLELRVIAVPAGIDADADAATEVTHLIRDLVPETRIATAGNSIAPDAPYLRVVAGRMVIRHRRSVLAKVEALVKQLESTDAGGISASITSAPR
ncbi:MAG: hypothetical protein WD875_02515 [Pirellulales bacterium]